MSEPLRVSFTSLRKGAIDRSWRLDEPGETLGGAPDELGPLEVRVRIEGGARGGVRMQGRIRSTARTRCRRCLTSIEVPVDVPVDVWFRPEAEVMEGEDGVWPVSPDAVELDLLPALREEVLLAAPHYPLCEDGCAGLCPTCGVRLVDEICTCEPPGPDSRWAALDAARGAVGEAAGEAEM